MTNATTQFDGFFEGLGYTVRRKAGPEARMSLAAVAAGKYRCVIFERGFEGMVIDLDDAPPEMPKMHVGTGKTATEAFDAAMEEFEANDEEE